MKRFISQISLLFAAAALASAQTPSSVQVGSVNLPVNTAPAVAGIDGSNIPHVLLVDASGNLMVNEAAAAPVADATATGSITTQNLNPNSGTATVGSTVAITGLNWADTLAVQVSGTYTGALSVQGTLDGVNWITLPQILNSNTNVAGVNIPSAANGIWWVGGESFAQLRVTALSAMTGTAVVTMRISSADASVALDGPFGQATMAASSPVTIASDQSAVPVNLPDKAITGQGSQTALNNNIILAAAGAGSTTALGYRSWSIEIIPAAGTVTAGVITFEGSNDNSNWQPIYLYDQNTPQAALINSYTIVAATNRFFKGPLQWQFVRARISVGITGTTTGVQAYTVWSQAQYAPDVNVSAIQFVGNNTPNAPLFAQAGVLPVGMPDLAITGQGSQTTLNNNIILSTAGAGATTALGYRSWSIQINVAAGTVTAGAITFEGSNDATNWQTINMYDQGTPLASPNGSYSIVAATSRWFKGPLQWAYIRARISTGITGTTTGVQAYTTLSVSPFIPDVFSINSQSLAGTTVVNGGVTGVQAIGGNVTNGGTTTAYPVGVSGVTNLTVPSAAIAAGKVIQLPITGDQQLIIHSDGDPSNEWSATSGTTALATNSQTALKAAGGAGIRNYCTGIQLTNSSTTVATTVTIQDGSTSLWTVYLPESTATNLPPTCVEFRTPLKGTAATAMNIICGTTGASVYYNVQGFQNN